MEKTVKNTIIKIAILGAESTGKTTLCEDLASYFNTVYVPEFARSYFDAHDINSYDLDDLDKIAKQQHEIEKEKLKTANRFVFCDTTALTIKIWSQHKFNKIPKSISRKIKATDYDLYLVCNNDVAWIADAQRKDPNLREHVFKLNKHELTKINADYHVIKGINKQRFENAIAIINQIFNVASQN
jgi:NadR type nicotinamide-nucleotide adenylyltransferase